jgi:very-short-patch-repair endonuclease
MDGAGPGLIESEVKNERGSGVEVGAILAPSITFASHQNDIAALTDLVVRNDTNEEIEGAILTITADPPVLGTRSWSLDRVAPRSELRPRDRRVPLAGGLLDRLTDRLVTDVRFELRVGDRLLAEAAMPLTALARNEWGGSRYVPELLAAFVLPNDPAVQRFLKDASNLLVSGGKLGSLDGYQSGSRSRAWELMSGVWAAVTARALTYAEPPASFESTGQKIRLPSDVASSGLATCLDTALLFCACFEQAGLHPMVVFTKGHAFAGAWLQPQHLPSMTTDDPQVLRKAIALNELVLFETTLAAQGHPLPFAKAIAEANRQLEEENDNRFVCAVDVRQARRRGIQPLSSHAAAPAPDGTEAPDVRLAPALDVVPDLPLFDIGAGEEDQAPKTPAERLDRWKRSLLDLSKRNRLLSLKATSSAIPIFCPDPARLEDRIAEGKRIRLIPPPSRSTSSGEVDPTLRLLRTGDDLAEDFAREALERGEAVANTDERSLEKGTIELYRKARADLEEGGSNTLFLALGMLRWSPRGDAKASYRAPMILLPVRIERASARSKPYLLRHEDDPVFNLTLLEMLRQDFGIDMPDLAGELPRDGSGIDVAGIWNRVRVRIKDVPGFEVVSEVVLSTFSFAKYLMWRDLSDRTEVLKRTAVVRHLIDHPREPYQGGASFLTPREVDARIDPASLMAPLNADSSQIVAIHASGGDGDMVLEGPPGTGKSETIGNIIAHNLGLGRRVLFMSEKMAALDVVYRRLAAAGLGDLCLELHSAKANKKEVLRQLDAAWSRRGEATQAQWEAKAAELSRTRARLNDLVRALHLPGPAGISARDAIGRTLRFGDVHPVVLDWPRTSSELDRVRTRDDFEMIVETARRLGQQFSVLTDGDVATFGHIAHGDWSNAWQSGLTGAAREAATAVDEVLGARSELLGILGLDSVEATRGEIEALAAVGRLMPSCAEINLAFALAAESRETLQTLRDLSRQLTAYRQMRERLSLDYPDGRISGQPVEELIAARDEARARSFLFRGGATRAVRARILLVYGVSAGADAEPENDLETLRELARARDALDAAAASLPNGTPWHGASTDLTALERAVEAGAALRTAAIRLAEHDRDLPTLRAHLMRSLCEGRDLLGAGGRADKAAQRLVAAADRLTRALAGYREMTGAPEGEPVDLASLAASAREVAARERRLSHWCAWVEVRREARDASLGALVDALEQGRISHDRTADAFRTAYCRWAAPLLVDASDPLRRFSAVSHSALIDSFRRLDADLSAMTSDIIRARLSAQVPSRNSLTAGPGFGVLSRELQKKAAHKPVRQIVSQMGSALTTLTPCLLMSPLSVAQFLPADAEPFDLVVFDEASQITVYDAVGAIARGKRAIIVGDPKQMPPTRFFEKGADEDEAEDEADLESILDEALAARVPLHRLTGHYRSRHESLIAFSNHAYYGGELVTYPSADTRDMAVSFRRVPGVYARGKGRTNAIEARALVAEAVDRLRDPARRHLSLGIVTFNSEQQRLIQDLLDDERRRDPSLEPFFAEDARDPVFVKNLETVQGDQRDVILISVGYGPTEPGAATMPMSFGPLNRKGGERRLNVAITRATSEVVIFASFEPTMIDLTRTSAEAVRDLRHYLEFAERGPAALGAALRDMGDRTGYDSDFEMAVAEGLRARGWSVRTQIGVSKFRIDLGIIHPDAPGRFLSGVECDGATYHSSPSARDRDRVRHVILEQLGWRLVRIWSTDWFNDREGCLERLDEQLRSLLDQDRRRLEAEREAQAEVESESATTVPEASKPTPQDEPGRSIACLDAGEVDRAGIAPSEPLPRSAGEQASELRPASLNGGEVPEASLDEDERLEPLAARSPEADFSRHDANLFHEPSYRTVLRDMAVAIIAAEGPVTFKRLSDLIAREHGFKKTGKLISSTVWAAVKDLGPRTRGPDDRDTFWPSGTSPQVVLPFRGLAIAGRERDWDEVPLPEKLGLVRRVSQSGPPDLARAVAVAIGYKRLTDSFREEVARLETMLRAVVSDLP